jgi:flagellar basal-body rod protein FlgB
MNNAAAMSMGVETRLSDQIARYLDLATSEVKLTAANMANIDTPATGPWGWTSSPRCAAAMAGVDQGQASRPRSPFIPWTD